MSAEFAVELHERFSVRSLWDRTRELTGLGSELGLLVTTPDVVHRGAAPQPAPPEILDRICGPADEPDVCLRLMTLGGVADLNWVEIEAWEWEDESYGGGMWMSVSATWRNEQSVLLSAYAAIAGAQLGASTVQDDDRLLRRGEPLDPDALLQEFRAAAPADVPPWSDEYAAAVLLPVRGGPLPQYLIGEEWLTPEEVRRRHGHWPWSG